MSRFCYFDYAAATPLDPRVKKVMDELYQDYFYNPSATYEPAQNAKAKINESKKIIAHHLGAKPAEIVFTSGGSESNNLAIRGVLEANPGGKVLVSDIEHESVLAPASLYNCDKVAIDKKGIIDLDELAKKLTKDVVLVSVIHASNEIGTIQPLKEIARLIAKERTQRAKNGQKTPIYLHTDACQTAGILDIHVHSLGVDLLTINGGKIYGPPQTGALFVGSKVRLRPQILGGNQQRGLRSGTLNAYLVVGLAKAFDLAQKTKNEELARLRVLQQKLIKDLQAKFPEAKFNGSMKHRSPANLNVSFPGQPNERLILILEKQGILVSAGAACAAANDEPSYVLEALGLNKPDIDSSIRISLGRHTTEGEIDRLVKALQSVLA
jgi:cysteine desulfurase